MILLKRMLDMKQRGTNRPVMEAGMTNRGAYAVIIRPPADCYVVCTVLFIFFYY